MNRIHGVVIGLVTNNNDPDGRGRVRVKFPWLSDDNQSPWARVATLMAGKKRGSWFMPEVDDEVLVAFDHGDINHPYVVGFLWNGVDTPPDDDGTTQVRRLRTVSGHMIEFDDRPGQEAIRIETQGQHQIELDDTSGKISIQTKMGNSVEIADVPGKITIQTKMGNSVEIADAPPGISIKTEVGLLQISCLQAIVTAKTLLQITAPMLQVNGLVQVNGAVLATAYSPFVPGNLFGL